MRLCLRCRVIEPRYPDPALSDNVIELRRWSFDDLHCIAEASADPVIVADTTVPEQWSVDAGREFIERQWSRVDNGEGVSLAVHSHELGRAVGFAVMMLRPQAGVIGLGYWIVPSARGRGHARRAATLASDWGIGRGGFARIEAWTAPDNVASQSVLAAAGFEFEGRLRSFLTTGNTRSDALVYSRIAG
jgi:[ribosomal protein S5]-alanine N-acetyltransferase